MVDQRLGNYKVMVICLWFCRFSDGHSLNVVQSDATSNFFDQNEVKLQTQRHFVVVVRKMRVNKLLKITRT